MNKAHKGIVRLGDFANYSFGLELLEVVNRENAIDIFVCGAVVISRVPNAKLIFWSIARYFAVCRVISL